MSHLRPVQLTNAPLQSAPTNELGVVYLFAHLARKLQFRIEQIRPGFPDCIAFRHAGDDEKRVRIEFEFRSSNFRTHGHDARGCDCIVCWHHDWPDVPKRLEIIELKQYFGVQSKVWIQPVIKSQWHWLEIDKQDWGLSKRASIGDLLLMYRCYPDCRIEDVFRLNTELSTGRPDWRDGKGYFGQVTRVCRLSNPIFLDDFRTSRVLQSAPFVRRNMQGNHLVSEYWPHLHRLICKRNPAARKALRDYEPAVC